MLWFFERGDERLQCEIRPSTEVTGYELEWVALGQVHIERSTNVDDLAKRWAELEQRWKQDGWVKIGDAVMPQRSLSGSERK